MSAEELIEGFDDEDLSSAFDGSDDGSNDSNNDTVPGGSDTDTEPVLTGGNDSVPGGDDTIPGGSDTVPSGNDSVPGGDKDGGGDEVAFTPAMTKEEVEAMNRDHLLQTGVMNTVSDADKSELGRFASVMYRGNTMKGSRIAMREALRDKLKMQDVAFEHSKLYSYAF